MYVNLLPGMSLYECLLSWWGILWFSLVHISNVDRVDWMLYGDDVPRLRLLWTWYQGISIWHPDCLLLYITKQSIWWYTLIMASLLPPIYPGYPRSKVSLGYFLGGHQDSVKKSTKSPPRALVNSWCRPNLHQETQLSSWWTLGVGSFSTKSLGGLLV